MLKKIPVSAPYPANFLTSKWAVFIPLLVTAILYIPVFKNQFVWDDELYIFQNPFLKNLSFENIKNIFSSYFGGNYHPLTMVSLSIDYQIGGIKPWAYQLTNLILHLCNTFFVYKLIKALQNLHSSFVQKGTIIPVVVALLFGIHPLQVESVAWISERKNVLYAFFFLASLIMYTKYIGKKSSKSYVLSAVLFLLSLLSKGTAIPLAVSVLLIDYLAGRNLLSKKVILEKLPYFALSVVFGIVAIWAQRSSNSIQGENVLTLFERMAIASYGFIQYLIKLLVPHHLSAFYPYPIKPGASLPGYFYLFIALVLLLVFIIWRYARQNKVIVFGMLYFIANISVVIQLLPVGEAVMADRYVYISSIGAFLIFGYVCDTLWTKKNAYSGIIVTVAAIYCLFLCTKTYQQIGVWKDNLTLWNDVLKKYPENNEKGYHNRGNVYYSMGLYPEALQDFNRLLQINPENSAAYIGTGLIKQTMNDTQGAMNDFDTSLKYKQSYEGYIDRAMLKINLANLVDAAADLEKALQINKWRPEVHLYKGIIELNTGNDLNAIAAFNKAIELGFNNSQAYMYRAVTKINQADYTGAVSDLNISIQLQPNADAYYFRGVAKIQSGLKTEGCNDLQQAVLLGNTEAQMVLNEHCK